MKLDKTIDKLLKFAEEKFDLHTGVLVDDLYVFGLDYFNSDIKISYHPEIMIYSKEILGNRYVIENGILFIPAICKGKNGYPSAVCRMYPNFFLECNGDSIIFDIKHNSIKIAALRNVDIQTKIAFYDKDYVIDITKKQFDDCIDFIKELNNFKKHNILVDKYKIQIKNHNHINMVMDKLKIPENISEIFTEENSIFISYYYNINNTIGCILELECNEDLFEIVKDQVNLLYMI